MRRHTRSRWAVGASLAALLMVAASVIYLPSTPAVADDAVAIPVSTNSELLASLTTNCISGSVVVAQASLTLDSFTITCDVTLDLNAKYIGVQGTVSLAVGDVQFTVRDGAGSTGRLQVLPDGQGSGFRVPSGSDLIVEGGNVFAEAGPGGAGIGGAQDSLVAGSVHVHGGTVTAVGGRWGAGIGGRYDSVGVELFVSGGTVNAIGGSGGPGVGPGHHSKITSGVDLPRVEVSGGTLNATGGEEGAGIGTAANPGIYLPEIAPDGVRLFVTGGVVNAQGGDGGAGIGGGYNAPGIYFDAMGGRINATGGENAVGIGAGETESLWGSTAPGRMTIGEGAVVTATSDAGLPSVGGTNGYYYNYLDLPQSSGLVYLDGDLYIGSGVLQLAGRLLAVGATGRLMGSESDPSSGFIIGSGDLRNYGTVVMPFLQSETRKVLRNNYRLSFDLASGTGVANPFVVLAPTLVAGFRDLPPDPTREGYFFNGWTMNGEPFAANTLLPGASGPDGPEADDPPAPGTNTESIELTITATWIEASAAVLSALGSECVPDSTWVLPADVTIASRIPVSCDVTLDLHGHELMSTGFDVAPGVDFSVVDSVGTGSVTAVSVGSPAFAGTATSGLSLGATTYVWNGFLLPAEWGSLTITPTGQLLGSPAAPTTGRLDGSGRVNNQGVIGFLPSAVDDAVEIAGNNFRVTFATGGAISTPTPLEVYAPSFTSGFRTLPADPVRGIDRFEGWTLGGVPFTATSTMTGSSSTGAPVTVGLAASWTTGFAAVGPDVSAASGVVEHFTPTLTGGDGQLRLTPLAWTVDAPAEVTVTADSVSGTIGVSALIAGVYPITASYAEDGRTYSDSFSFTVVPGPVAGLLLTFTGQAKQGETITVTAVTIDAAGNIIEDVSNQVALASSVPTDVIVGNTVTFVHASPHIITATLNGTEYTGNLALEVEAVEPSTPPTRPSPSPPALSSTGSTLPVGLIALALLSIALGIAMGVRARHRAA